MRLSNYLSDIDWQLRDTLHAIRELEPLHRLAERNWRNAENAVETQRVVLTHAEAMRDELMEKFRDVHETLSKLKSWAGELQGERFNTADDEEDWLSRHTKGGH